MAQKKRKHILYVQTSGINTPKRLYSPFVLAMTAKAMDMDATVYFLGEGITLMKKGEAEKIKEGSFPTVKEIMDQAAKAGVKFLACDQSCQLMGIEKGNLVGEATVVGAATLNDRVLDADATMWF